MRQGAPRTPSTLLGWFLTAEDAEDAKEIGASGHRNIETSEDQNLPRMDAGECALKGKSRPVEWKPSPDMYRMDTQEGMEAYEASFRMKMKPWLDRAGTPPGAAVPHEHGLLNEHAEVHANLG